jgi:hypothetical protein
MKRGSLQCVMTQRYRSTHHAEFERSGICAATQKVQKVASSRRGTNHSALACWLLFSWKLPPGLATSTCRQPHTPNQLKQRASQSFAQQEGLPDCIQTCAWHRQHRFPISEKCCQVDCQQSPAAHPALTSYILSGMEPCDSCSFSWCVTPPSPHFCTLALSTCSGERRIG